MPHGPILIRHESVRKVGVAVASVLAVASLVAGRALGDDAGAGGSPRATMTCERVDAPGRVRCDVEARVEGGESISWGDVVITRTPAFAGALRGRIGPHDATTREAELWRWALALVAREKGSGDVEARVRVVVCKGEACTPREVPVKGRVVVGE
jgi:hypothetical protein